jgi:hypothetical protein
VAIDLAALARRAMAWVKGLLAPRAARTEESVERLKSRALRIRGQLAPKPGGPHAAKRFEAAPGVSADMPDAADRAAAERVAKKPEREPPGGLKPPEPPQPPPTGGTHVDRLLEIKRRKKRGP